MTQNQKIVLGIGAVVIAYYLYTTNKNKAVANQQPSNPPQVGGNPCPNGQKLQVVNCIQAPCPSVCVDDPYSKGGALEPRSFNCQSGKPFSLKDNIINGVIPNLTGGTTTAQAIPNILFKKGDLVCGDVITQYIFNKNVKGILAKPTVKNAYSETPMQFIPIEFLTPLSDS